MQEFEDEWKKEHQYRPPTPQELKKLEEHNARLGYSKVGDRWERTRVPSTDKKIPNTDKKLGLQH